MRITVSVAKRRSREKPSIRSAAPCPNIWNHLATVTPEEKRTPNPWRNARLQVAHRCREDYGVYIPQRDIDPIVLWLWSERLSSSLSLLSVSSEMNPKTEVACSLSSLWQISRNLWRIVFLRVLCFFVNRSIYIYYRHYDSSLFQIMSYIAIYLS